MKTSRPASPSTSGRYVPLWSTEQGVVGLVLVMLTGLGELPLVLSFAKRTGELGAPPWSIPHVVATTFLPALLMVLGDGLRRRWLYGVGLIWLVIAGALCVAGGLVWILGDMFGLVLLGSGALTLFGASLMDSSKRP